MDEPTRSRHERWTMLAAKPMLEENEAFEIMEDFEGEMGWVRAQAEVDPWDAYSSLMTDIVLFNRAFASWMPRWPSIAAIQNKLKQWVNVARGAVEAVARALPKVFKVSGYSVGAGFPMGISVSISFSL